MRKQKANLANNYLLAVHIRDWVATLLDSKVKPKSLFELYPDLFKEETEMQKQRDWELNKERMREYAEQFNQKMKKGE